MVVRELFSRLGLQVDRGSFRRGDQAISGIKTALAGVGIAMGSAVIVRGFKRLLDDTVGLGDAMDKLSGRTGIAAATIQEFRHAAALTGVDARTADDGLQRMSRRLTQASHGHGAAKRAVEQYGIQLRDSNGQMLDAENLLLSVTDAMSRTSSEADALALAYDVFGRSGEDLALTLKGGREALEAMMQAARDSGGVMSDELVRQSAELRDEQERLRMSWKGVANDLAGELVPELLRGARSTLEWVRVNRQLIRERVQQFARGLAYAFRAVANTVRVLVVSARTLLEMIDGLAGRFGALGVTLGRAAIAAGILVAIFGAKKLIILLLIGLIGLIADEIATALSGGRTMIDLWDDFLKRLRSGEGTRFPLLDALVAAFDTVHGIIRLVAASIYALATGDMEFLKAAWAETFKEMQGNAKVAGRLIDNIIDRDEKLKQMGSRIPDPISLVARGIRGAGELGGRVDEWMAGRRGIQPQGGGQSNVTLHVENKTEVHGATGTDAPAIADEINRQLRDTVGRVVEEAYRENVPAGATP